MTILLSASDLARCLDPADVATTVERACAAYSAGLTDTPLRGVVHPRSSTAGPSGSGDSAARRRGSRRRRHLHHQRNPGGRR